MPSTGAKSAGMAGAWIAQGDDLAVMDHNPAQLVRQRDIAVTVQYTAYLFDASYQPDPIAGLGEGPATGNAGDYINHIPNLYAAFPIGERLTLGTGVFSPIGPRHTYSDSGPQRYQMQQAVVQLAWITAAAAYQIADPISVSLSLDTAYVNATQKLALGLIPGYRSLDGSLNIEGSGFQTPRPKLGVLYEPREDFSIGFVAAPGFDISIKGDVYADVPQAGLYPETARDKVTAYQRYPSEARLGFGYTPGKFRSELALRYYRWSEYTQQTVDLENNVIGGFAIDDLTMPKHYRDSYAIQIGGGYRYLDNHEVRGGYLFDQQAVEDRGLTITDFDAPKHVFALGYGVNFGERYTVDASYNFMYYQERQVKDSTSEAIAVVGESPDIGNGTYAWNVHTLGVAIGVRF